MGSAKRTEFQLFKTIKKIEKWTGTGKGNGVLTAGTSELKSFEKDRDQLEKVELTEMVFHSGGQKD